MGSCPKCKGVVVEEDKVLFCEECFYVIDRNNASDFSGKRYVPKPTLEPNPGPGRPGRRKERWPQWRRKLIAIVKATRWEPGKMVKYNPRKLRGTIIISKTGGAYYRYGN